MPLTSPVGLGGGGAVAISLEAVPGTYQDPDTVGTVWVPILSEEFKYTEEKYYSPQLRMQTVVSDVKQSYYHIEGPITMEVDTQYLPYFLHCSRHVPAFAGGEFTYIPSSSASVNTTEGSKTASVTIFRNNEGFGYSGCVFGSFEFTIENGVLRVTMNALGLAEEDPGGLDTFSPTFASPKLLGADAHHVYIAASGATPTFAAADTSHNGFTFSVNYNAAAQNRIVADRAASYISYGETEATYTTELDFIDRTEYDNFVAATTRAIKLESYNGASWAASTDGVRLQANRSAYDTYDVGLAGMGDLIMAGVTGRIIGVATGNPFEIHVKSTVTIA